MENDIDIEDYRNFAREKRRNLSASDELALAARIAEGDNEAVHELVDSNLEISLRYAEEYHQENRYQKTEIMQLVRAANEGLYRAARAYSRGKGKNFRFAEYAVWWVKHYLDRRQS